MFTVKYWDNYLYPKTSLRDPVEYFVNFVEGRIAPDCDVLDVGAGAGERNTYNLRGNCKQITGVDFDARVTDNPLLDLGVVQTGSEIPIADSSIDVAFSLYVLEHVEHPALFCSEIARVLKPGGEFWALTPNTCHYVPVIARLTPHAFHEWLNGTRGRDHGDTFPTFYRLNSRKMLRTHFRNAGMDEIDTQLIESRPNYLAFSLPAFLMGAAYERVVNSTALLAFCRVNLVTGFRLATT